MNVMGRVVLLVALWLLAWGEVSVGNVVSGLVVAGVLLLAFPPGPRGDRRVRLRPAGVVRLAGYVVVQLVTSNIVTASAILRRRPAIRQGVLAHRLQRPSEEVVTVMTSVIALSPGTMTADVDRASTTVYVHFLMLRDIDAARASLARLERLANRALFDTDDEESAAR